MFSKRDGSSAAVRARGLAKIYTVYEQPEDRLKQFLWRWRGPFYREFPAVSDVNLDVFPGEAMAIVGRNGSGKTTLLQMLGGILTPTSGELEVQGVIAPILTLGAGFNPEFTGRENVIMNSAVLGMSSGEIRNRLDSIIAFADVGSFFDQPLRTYSAGMHARLAFAIAIHTDPDILIIDEILAVGDEAFARKCFARLAELKAMGTTILFSSHSPSLVIELADRALLLEGGRRLLVAEPKRVIARYQRLVHAPADQQSDMASAIRAEESTGIFQPPDDALPGSETLVGTPEAQEGHYEAELRPTSRLEYVERGARILGALVLDSSGRSVNVLRPDHDYVYYYEVNFIRSCYCVRFAMLLKLVTGFELYGRTSHPPGEGIPRVNAGTTAEVRFPFRTQLVPGTYFLNAGVHGIECDEEIYLHRVMDAMMFRIDPEKQSSLTGRVDLGVGSGCEFRLIGGG